MQEDILFYSLKYAGNYQQISQALKNNEAIDSILFDKLKKRCQSNYVVITQENYPKVFYDLKNPPFVVYYYGNIQLASQETIGIIGTRHPSDHGKHMCDVLVHSLNPKWVVVSGLAIGIDSLAQRYAQESGMDVVAVLGSGIDYCYPKSNQDLYQALKKQGLVISEYPFDTKPLPYYFLWRNRLVAALSNRLLIIEAKTRSGTMSTATYALELGKDIYCVPGCVEMSSGCHQLIKEGAYLCDCVNDLI